jgi:indole-3-glycerol phosphate synthase
MFQKFNSIIMNILDQIVSHKINEVAERESLFPTKLLQKSIYFESTPVSLKKYLLRKDKSGIIAEIKRKSPSKGILNTHFSVEGTSIGYMQAGASALSILTDEHFFGGSNNDLITARKFNFCPILRKDFIIDEYQVIEAKAIGADAILLIAAILNPEKIKSLADLAHSLGLEVLLEVHNESEIFENENAPVDLIGVNNRDLKTFRIGIETSERLSKLLPDNVVKISESGIDCPEVIHHLRQFGYNGFLIGQTFMQQTRPERACKEFIDALQKTQVAV